MKLHWSPRSPFVRKVMVVAHEKSLVGRIELMRTLVAMTAPNAPLMKENPLNKIPTLVLADGTILYDSRVITEYLDDIGIGPRLLPASGPERYRALRQQATGDGLLDLAILWRNELNRPASMQMLELLAAFEAKAAATIDSLERDVAELSNGPFGIGHVSIAVALSYFDFRFAHWPWRNGRDRLAIWHSDVGERPSFSLTAPIDDLESA